MHAIIYSNRVDLTFIANLSVSGKYRRVVESGREFIVASASMIVPGVLNGSKGALYYPPEETSRNPATWNGLPLVVYHPISPDGQHISASSPGVYERQGVGRVRNSRYDGKLRSEAWFDVEHTKRVDMRVYNRLINNEPIELSTGLYTENDYISGTSPCGRSYTAIARNYRGDHLAILPDQRGACSLDDGCGIGVNSMNANSCNCNGKCRKCRRVANKALSPLELIFANLSDTKAAQIKNMASKCQESGRYLPKGAGNGKGETHAAAKAGYAATNPGEDEPQGSPAAVFGITNSLFEPVTNHPQEIANILASLITYNGFCPGAGASDNSCSSHGGGGGDQHPLARAAEASNKVGGSLQTAKTKGEHQEAARGHWEAHKAHIDAANYAASMHDNNAANDHKAQADSHARIAQEHSAKADSMGISGAGLGKATVGAAKAVGGVAAEIGKDIAGLGKPSAQGERISGHVHRKNGYSVQQNSASELLDIVNSYSSMMQCEEECDDDSKCIDDCLDETLNAFVEAVDVQNWCNQYGGTTCKDGSSGDKAQKAKDAKAKATTAKGGDSKKAAKQVKGTIKKAKAAAKTIAPKAKAANPIQKAPKTKKTKSVAPIPTPAPAAAQVTKPTSDFFKKQTELLHTKDVPEARKDLRKDIEEGFKFWRDERKKWRDDISAETAKLRNNVDSEALQLLANAFYDYPTQSSDARAIEFLKQIASNTVPNSSN